MDYLKKFGKILLLTFGSILILGLIISVLYHFDIISNNIYNILKLISVLVTLFINAILLGKNTDKYGLIEGLKLGAAFLLFMIVLKLITNNSFDIRTFIYSFIILLTTCVGAVIGINKKEKK